MSFLLQNQLTEALRVEEDEEPEQRKTRSQPQLIPLFHLFPSRGWQLACVCLDGRYVPDTGRRQCSAETPASAASSAQMFRRL